MSHEILLIAGPGDDLARAWRLRMLEHACPSVPGHRSHVVLESATAAAALVDTSPAGGSFASAQPCVGGGSVTVATTLRGLDVPEQRHAADGAEAGHVTAALHPDGSVHVANDGLGSVPTFWGVSDGTLLLSTHLASLVSLGMAAQADAQGLLEYLTMLHPLGDRTLLSGASLLPGGTSLSWRTGHVDRTRKMLFQPSDETLSDDDALAAFAETWSAVMADVLATSERTSIALSGGLDSRAIAEAAVQLGHSPLTYTYGGVGTSEGRAASRVARSLGLPHLAIPVSDDRLLAQARSSLDLLDGAHSASEMYELWFSDLLRSCGDLVVNGLNGDLLMGSDKATGLQDPEAVRSVVWKRYAGEVAAMAPFLAAGHRGDAEPAVRRSLSDSLGEWDLAARSDMVLFWRMDNRQQRWGTMLTSALRRIGVRSELPFMDARLLALTARLTPDQRRHGAWYLRVHREVFPRSAKVPRSSDGNAPRALDHVYWAADTPYLAQLGKLTLRHPVSGVRRGLGLAAQVALPHLRAHSPLSGPADRLDARRTVFPADLWLRTRAPYSQRLRELLEAGRGATPLLDDEAIDRAVEGLRRGTPTAPALTLGKVASAQLWLHDYQRREAARRSAETAPPASSINLAAGEAPPAAP
ncbi:asparagine synthetase B family protein [Propioniciclava sinopodophylli]|uniref:asparagine synthase (glutamine-hydrolyzing) n=1 Tax=Propioniciclava sinopodophylli TaxID=1837344 RepID=A0A4Q9KJ41_9ACTN|nr:asparagine synthetase B family protein [Propioniciclava sinopodophylli]TBT88636.1 asparagine synthetase B family protein [Propioniciclava sinopodophylli]